ncbi:MAG: transglycosylase SLT domain-containing protein [Gammaproteobacteria bacterium]
MARIILRGSRFWRTSAGLLAVIAAAALLARTAYGADVEAQRTDFLKAYAAAEMGKASWRAWAEELKGYPLYPYLPAAQLEHNLHGDTTREVADYLKRYHGLIPAADLRRHYLQLLAKRRDWNGYLTLYRPGLGETLTCYALRARIARGGRLDFERDLAALWQKPSLPSACGKVQVWAHDHGLLTPQRLWQRITRAAGARRAGTIAFLARWLPHGQAVVARRYVEGLRRPTRAVRNALDWPDSGRNREAALLAITELARKDSKRALRDWPALDRHFDFSAHARDEILRSLALYRAYGFHDDALGLLSALPDAARTDATRDWRVRVAIARRDWPAALAALDDALAGSGQPTDAWRYLRARVLQKLGKTKQARAQFEALDAYANYWGFLSADRLYRPYVICPQTREYDPGGEQALLAHPGFARAFELYAVNMLRAARREWARAIDEADAQTRRRAADLAYRRGWFSRPIFVYNHGAELRRYRERFPITERERIHAAVRKTGLDTAWIYATIRAESAWIPDAGSHAGARGLMQLMSATAHHVARRHHVSSSGFRYDPGVNIRLGTYYLEHLADLYEGRLWLASAAYNAGSGRVNRWLDARGELAPDFFIATIPFTETRNYVIRIAAYSVIYGWRLDGKPTALAWRLDGKLADRGKRVYKAVVCPSSGSAAPAASAR